MANCCLRLKSHESGTTISQPPPKHAMRRLLTPFLYVSLLAALALWGYLLIPSLFFPSGVWHRKVVREHPLKDPIPVTHVLAGKVITADGREFTPAGIEIKDMALATGRADAFLKLVTSQGVEIIQAVEGSDYLLRCEPAIWHWCGNDSVSKHYEQANLSELLLVFGFATLKETISLNPLQQERLRVAAEMGSGRTAESNDFREWGLNISRAMHLDFIIQVEAQSALREKGKAAAR
jgi:hypothetical protein